MRKYLTTAMAIALMSGVSYADLQNVEVGAEIRIRGNSYFNTDAGDDVGQDGSHNQFTEQYTAVSVNADFTDDVSAHITFNHYGNWGEDNYEYEDSSIDLYEANIVLEDAFAGVDLKIGRQEVLLGSEFLVGNENTASFFQHQSFDGIRADYGADAWHVSIATLKLVENDAFSTNVDNDVDFNFIYGTYTGIENHTIDAYVMQLREGIPGNDNDELLTIGARAAGNFGNFDYELEIATQSGDNPGSDYEGDAVNLEVGYSFDTNMQPRVFAGYTTFSGSDDEEGFDRLFSDWEYSEFLGDGDITNVNIMRLGVSANVTEKIGLTAVISSFEIDDVDAGGIGNDFDSYDGTDDDLGTEIGLYATYQYSEDVAVEVGAATLLLGDSSKNELEPNDEDPIYVYAEISLSF